MSNPRDSASINVPEWRLNAAASGNSPMPNQINRMPNISGEWKLEGGSAYERSVPEVKNESGEQTLGPKSADPSSEVSLECLGRDIWFLLSSYVAKGVLLSICQTSSALHSQVIPILYHTIDLSIPHTADFINCLKFRRSICRRQYLLERQISQTPEYGEFVRSLKWTVAVETEGFNSAIVDRLPRTTEALSGFSEVAKLFTSMDRVVSLDLNISKRSGEMTAIPESMQLFPAAQHVNLGNLPNVSILSGEGKFPLSFLQLGPYPIGRPDPTGLTRGLGARAGSTRSPTVPTPKAAKYPDLLHSSLQLRCKGLHTLSVILQHLDTPEIREFYTSLSSFLPSIRPRNFIFYLVGMNGQPLPQPLPPHLPRCTQCTEVPGHYPVRSRFSHLSHLTSANIIPENFERLLLPTLREGWDGLQRLEIKGVMKKILVVMKNELSERGVELVGDGWEQDFAEASHVHYPVV